MTTSVISTLRPGVAQPAHLARLRVLDETDFDAIRKKVVDDRIKLGLETDSDWLERAILALKQYYAIAVLDPRNMHAISDVLDPVWHAHILHTRDYANFCSNFVGGFLHHDPLDHDDAAEVETIAKLYEYTTACMNEFFTDVDPEFFPTDPAHAELVCKHMDLDYDDSIYANGLKPAQPGFQLST